MIAACELFLSNFLLDCIILSILMFSSFPTGLPPGLVNVVFGTGPSVGSEIIMYPSIMIIWFTGLTRVGKYIQEKTAPYCKKLSLEVSTYSKAIYDMMKYDNIV